MRSLLPAALGRLKARELLISEFFASIQGESSHAGRPCFFIRLAGCPLRCTWCDTAYSFDGGNVFSVSACVEQARRSGLQLVEVTGGEPLIQAAVLPLLAELCDDGFEVLLETSGAVAVDRVDPRVKRIIDWKCPGSAMAHHNNPAVLAALRIGDELKFVIKDREDYEWARRWVKENAAELPVTVPLHFSPVFDRIPHRDLAAWIVEDRLAVRLNLQIHKWIWDPATRGV